MIHGTSYRDHHILSSTPHRVGHWTKELRSPWCDVIHNPAVSLSFFNFSLNLYIARMIMYYKKITVVRYTVFTRDGYETYI